MTKQGLQGNFDKEQLQRILQHRLGKDAIVEDCSSAPNTKPGDNYGSVMLALKVDLRRKKDSPVETLHVIAKLAPPTEYLQTLFDFKNTFCKEMNLYRLVGPEFEQLQKENGVPAGEMWDNICKYYGAQTSLAGDEDLHADINAALLLENLKIQGYKTANRLAGLDLKHCELILAKLAEFHALPIVLRQQKPHVYEKTVLKAAAPCQMGVLGDPETDVEKMVVLLTEILPASIPYLERIRKQCTENIKQGLDHVRKEPFATIVHNDLWTNNMMFLYDGNSNPTDVKFVDFQTTLLCSPVKDLIFFLFTSTNNEVFRDHYDHLVNHYYKHFIAMIKKLNCGVSLFSQKAFQDEMNEFAPSQFYHVLFMIGAIYMEKSEVQDLSEIKGEENIRFAANSTSKHKLLTLIQEFDRRGWLVK